MMRRKGRKPLAESHMLKKLYRIGKEFIRQIKAYHLSAYASSTAFFTYLSLIPMMLVFFSILPYTPLTEAKLMEVLVKILPENMVPLSISIVADMYDNSGAVLSLTLIFTIWSSAKGTLALLRGLNVINRVEEKRNYFFLRMRACAYTIILLIMVLLLLILVVFGEWLTELLTGEFSQLQYFFDFMISCRFLFVIALLTLFFAAVYTWLPNQKNKFRFELPGALFVSLSWYLASWMFSVYVNHYFAYSMYGRVATVTVVMLWLYMGFYIVLLGAYLNRFLRPMNRLLRELQQIRRNMS